MGTKTTKSMYELAKAQAFRNDILFYEDANTSTTYVGYLLPRKSLNNLFRMEGFAKQTTIDKYIGIWEQLGLVRILGIGNHIFFYPQESDSLEYKALVSSRDKAKKDPDHMNDVYILEATA